MDRIIISMSEIPDFESIGIGRGASPETVAKWQEAGLINPKPLAGELRRVTQADIKRLKESGQLYRHLPEGLLSTMLEDTDTSPEPPIGN
jgi:hypothetical protein